MGRPRLAIITGRFRSGTSAVAQIINRLGVPVAVTLGCPHAVSGFTLDWEDPETFRVLSRWVPVGRDPISSPGFTTALREDFKRRWLAACCLAEVAGLDRPPPAIASKCPLYALCMDTVLEAAQDMFDVVVFRTQRADRDVERSIDRTYWSDAMRAAVRRSNVMIEAAGFSRGEKGMEIAMEEMLKDPEAVTREIATDLGVPYAPEAAATVLVPA